MKKTKHRLAECRANKRAKRIMFDHHILSRLKVFYEDKNHDRQERWTMYNFSHHLITYLRTGSIHTCNDCPRYLGLKYPEDCKYKWRNDHCSSHKEVAHHFKVWYTGYPRIKDGIMKEFFD